MTSFEDRALAALRRLTADDTAGFRDGQLEAIEHLVRHRTNVLCVQRTGWGKSAVYFIATSLLRADGAGATVIVSPLLALMRNQVEAAARLGIHAVTINSANEHDWDQAFAVIESGECDLLLISPERLNNPRFRARALDRLLQDAGLVVVDEAHCISDWGHDFRPDYRRIADVVAGLRPDAAVLCTTATANDRVIADIEHQLASSERPLVTVRGSLDRASLRLEVVDLPLPAQRLAWLATHVPALAGSGLVYCATVRDTELVASWLRDQGLEVVAYSGETDPEDRERVERQLTANEVKAVVATSALGMGYDKPDLGFVVHFQAPGSVIAYYQQVGRAGRGLERAHAVLLRGAEDRDIQDYFIDVAFPAREQVEAVLEALRAADGGMTLARLEPAVNVRRGRLEAMLKVLEVEGAVARTSAGRWVAVESDWAYDQERVDAVTAQRRAEQAAMETYGETDECLMAFLRRELDDPVTDVCGRCAACTARAFAGPLDDELFRAADLHIRRRPLFFEPRKRWAGPRSGTIAADRRAGTGAALGRYRDYGWGAAIRDGKWRDGSYSGLLVTAAAQRLREWSPDPPPVWVTAVPSLAHPALVPDFARRLADALELPFATAVHKTRQTRPQTDMENSAQQVRNVDGAFAADPALVRTGPVLLVDDLRDSGWTLTVVADLLRAAGSGPVHPFVLALSGSS